MQKLSCRFHLLRRHTRRDSESKFYIFFTDMPSDIANMIAVRTRIRDKQMHQQLKADLVEHIWCKFGRYEDNN